MATDRRILELSGQLEVEGRKVAVVVVSSHACCLLVRFVDGPPPAAGIPFEGLTLSFCENVLQLGPCRFEPHTPIPRRRKDDAPPDPGDGRLIFTDRVYDFSSLFSTGMIINLGQKVTQLPLMWRRKEEVQTGFREYTAALLYDMQVYRSLFDEIDRSMESDPAAVREVIQETVIRTEYPAFARFYQKTVDELEQQVRRFSKQQHEQHGFYFRKQVWDIIMTSQILARTNLKPRGYSGDSVIMNMIYDKGFDGHTIFSRFMHRFPLETAAAEAVRNRRVMLADRMQSLGEELGKKDGVERLRVLSVACGPSVEVQDVLLETGDLDRYEFVLLDQDTQALEESRQAIRLTASRMGGTARVHLVRESVRTMLRTARLSETLGQFHLVYSMGLFDYLTRPVARAVLAKLFELLRPGGELMIGNFHVQNPARVYMEYWADWVLFYRTEEELSDLARDLPAATCEMRFDETSSQMMMTVKKGGN